MAFFIQVGVAAIAVFLMALAMESDGRELRPSDHGLVYQDPGPVSAKSPTDEKSFFGGGGGENSPAAGDAALPKPKAMNSSDADASWWKGVVARDGGRRRDHVEDVLLVVSLLCGIAGVALFVASAIVYVLKYRKHKSLPSESPSS
ncbi:uncharacterized protein [Pyrus communis]|uniref:uncharacterized protein n=1 Tax=Pyrus communis TaxID=23211 RepID=UPI0035BFD2F9